MSSTNFLPWLHLFWFIVLFSAPLIAQENRIGNGSFDGSFDSKGVASGWEDNSSWAPVEVRYSKESPGADGKGSCQKIEVASFKGGAVQFVAPLAEPIDRFRKVTVSVQLKGEIASTVEVQIRKRGHPYTTYISKSFAPTKEWQTCSYTEIIPDSAPDMVVIIRLTGVGSVLVDNLKISDSPLTGPNPLTILTPPDRSVPPEFFGMHTHNHKFPDITWPSVPFKVLRFWDSRTAWANLEPRRGEWNFDRMDKLVALCQASNVQVLYTMALTPAWASARPDEVSAYTPIQKEKGWAAEPTDIEDWKNYVRAVATRYKGKVRHYEIWNEPNNNVMPLAFFTGTHAKLAELCREAYKVLKEVDHENVVISPSVVGSPAYVEGFLRAGGLGNFDKVGYHFYTGYNSKSPYDRAPERSIAEAVRLRGVMEGLGIGKLGIWNTEAGWYTESAQKPDTAPGTTPSKWVPIGEFGDHIARLYLLNWASGMEVFCFYAWDNGNMGLIENDGSEKPGASAYRTIQKWMVGNKMESCKMDEAENWIAVFSKPDGGKFRIVWREKDTAELDIQSWKAGEAASLYGKTESVKGKSAFTVTTSPKRLE